MQTLLLPLLLLLQVQQVLHQHKQAMQAHLLPMLLILQLLLQVMLFLLKQVTQVSS
jgi:hypothetical protein